MQTDEQIVEQVQKGDGEKFGEIIERYQGKLFGYVKNLINQNNMEVEDVVQDSLVAAYENLNGFDTTKKFSSWVYRIAHNKAIDYFKKKKLKISQIEEQEELIGENDKLLEELDIEEKKRVNLAIEAIELKYREVILLYYFEEKTYEEISDILHISINNVGVLLYRGKEKLKKYLESKI